MLQYACRVLFEWHLWHLWLVSCYAIHGSTELRIWYRLTSKLAKETAYPSDTETTVVSLNDCIRSDPALFRDGCKMKGLVEPGAQRVWRSNLEICVSRGFRPSIPCRDSWIPIRVILHSYILHHSPYLTSELRGLCARIMAPGPVYWMLFCLPRGPSQTLKYRRESTWAWQVSSMKVLERNSSPFTETSRNVWSHTSFFGIRPWLPRWPKKSRTVQKAWRPETAAVVVFSS